MDERCALTEFAPVAPPISQSPTSDLVSSLTAVPFASPFKMMPPAPAEQLPVADIVDDDNKMLSKVKMAINALCT